MQSNIKVMTVNIYTVHTIILYICIELVSKHRQYNLFLYTYIRFIYKKIYLLYQIHFLVNSWFVLGKRIFFLWRVGYGWVSIHMPSLYIVCVFLWCMGNTYAIILNFYWEYQNMSKITKMARPHRRPMSKRPDCYELIVIICLQVLYQDKSPRYGIFSLADGCQWPMTLIQHVTLTLNDKNIAFNAFPCLKT